MENQAKRCKCGNPRQTWKGCRSALCFDCYTAKERDRYRNGGKEVKQRNWALTREIRSQKQKEWYLNHREHVQNEGLQRLYGITLSDKQAMLEAQGGKCAICRTAEPGGGGWHLDHDHDTKKNRAILCSRCNLVIGMAQEDILRLKRCATYLMKHKRISVEDVFRAMKERAV